MHFLTNFILYVYAVTNERFELAMVLAMLVQILSDDGQDKSHNFEYFEKTSIGPKMGRFISDSVQKRAWIDLGIHSVFILIFSIMVELCI